MGLLDPIVEAFTRVIELFEQFNETAFDVDIDDKDAEEVVAQNFEDLLPFGEIFAIPIDLVEEFVISDLQEVGVLKPENIEGEFDEVEGRAALIFAATGLASSAIETLSIGQVDKQAEFLVQALAALGVQDVAGAELEARVSEGVQPALNAKVAKDHRSKFVDLQDAVEYALRNKETDGEYLDGTRAPQDVVDKIGSNNVVNPENILEEWGIRDDQLDILEEVALNDMEFEELIETPAELGLIVPNDVLEAELDRAGYSEATKEFLLQVNDRIKLSARAYDQLIISEEHIADLDQRVEDGTLTPSEAAAKVPSDLNVDADALQQRWTQKRGLAPKAPSLSKLVSALAEGYADLDETRDRLDVAELDTERFEGVLKAEIVGDLDGSLQEAVATGRLSETRFANLAEFCGLDDDVIDKLLNGQSFSDITKAKLSQERDPRQASVETIVGIGESRSQALEADGVESVVDLSNASVVDVAEAAGVSEATAEEFISRADQRV